MSILELKNSQNMVRSILPKLELETEKKIILLIIYFYIIGNEYKIVSLKRKFRI